MSTAVVVGSGPNGLAAAVHLARNGVDVQVLEAADEIGGGTRSGEYTLPGLIHDHCSAFHPVGAGSPFLTSLDLGRHGLRWCTAPIDCAHPLDGGDAALLYRSLDETAAGLGTDGSRWRRLMSDIVAGMDQLTGELMQPIVHLPRYPIRLATFGVRALLPATVTAQWMRTRAGRALYGGVAAHAYHRLDRPAGTAVGLMIAATGHVHGWPVAEGGSRAIADALAAELAEHAGVIHTGVTVRSRADLPAADVHLLDTPPGAILEIFGAAVPDRIARAYRRFRHAPGAFKLDIALEGPIPWTNPDCALAATVHVGGDYREIITGEREVTLGRMPQRPFVILGQQYVADPSRSAGATNPVYAYAHVPAGYTGDATDAIIEQIERFAPGFRDRILMVRATDPKGLQAGNPNLVGGDVVGGSNDAVQLLARPRVGLDPYSTGIPGVYICSASTPPGAGAHGMGGYNAATSALRFLREGATRSH